MPREKTLQNKNQIIDVAFDIVDAHGIEALSMRRVAKELGISPMTVYNYIESLNDIKKEVLIRAFDGLYEGLYTALSKNSEKLDAKIFCKTLAGEVYKYADEHKGLFIFMLSDGQVQFRSDAEVRPFYEFLSKFMLKSATLREAYIENTKGYDLFESMIFSIAFQHAVSGEPIAKEKYEEYVDYFLSHCT